MIYLNKSKKNNSIVTAVLIAATIAATPFLQQLQQQAYGYSNRDFEDAPMAESGDNVYVVWWSNRTGQFEVMFRASTDGGQTFSDKVNLSNTTEGQSLQATVAASGDNVYVMYLDNQTGNVETYIRTSTDAGETFGPPVMINGTGPEQRQAEIITDSALGFDRLEDSMENTQIAAVGDNVYAVVWDKQEPGNWDVFFSRSTDSGETFEDAVNLSNTSDARSDRAIMLADEEENVYITWWETATGQLSVPVMRVSNDAGETFGPVVMLAANGTISTTTTETAEEGEGGGG
ncbi:MAG: exo-alpha-sialidase [Thermoproteota archaeon]|nr:exo-alpha-sialidase [Thermoproteota archaeon]